MLFLKVDNCINIESVVNTTAKKRLIEVQYFAKELIISTVCKYFKSFVRQLGVFNKIQQNRFCLKRVCHKLCRSSAMFFLELLTITFNEVTQKFQNIFRFESHLKTLWFFTER